MPEPLLPLFPLSLVLLPSTPLPLHIFEERYKEMMGDIIPGRREFGVVLAREGGVANIGCTATVEHVLLRYPDGQLDVATMGRRRFQILSLDDEKSYLRASVEFFNDDNAEAVPARLRGRAVAAYKKLREALQEQPSIEPRLDDPQLSFQLAQFVEDPDHRQTMLGMKSEIERLEFFVRNLPDYLIKRERMLRARRVGPQNGHAKHYTE
jgi:Lon protease-like protein